MSDTQEQTSIPRYKRKSKGRCVNTCANSSLIKRMQRQLAGVTEHLERHPRDTLSQMRVSTITMLLSR